jgi:hypothetical protein
VHVSKGQRHPLFFDVVGSYKELQTLVDFELGLNGLGSPFGIETIHLKNQQNRIVTADKNAGYPKAFRELKAAGTLATSGELQQSI